MAWWDSSRRSLGASLRSKKQHPPVVEPPAPAPTGPHQKPRHIGTHTVPPHLTMELERALLSPITEEQPVVTTLAEATNTGPLVVHVHIQFHDQDLHSVTHSQTYVSSPYFEPTGRICNGLLRRIEHCSEELITRTDPTALEVIREGTHDRKPLRFELTYRVTRAGWMGEWAVRTYRSYQQRPLTAASAKDVIIASHETIGMFFRRHDSDFRWLGGSVLDATTETAESSLESEVGQISLGAVPSPRFVEESQTFESVPGYSIEVAFRHRNPRRLIPAFKRVVKVYSKQVTPLTAEMGRDLLASGAEAINRSLGLRKQKLEIHAQQCSTMTCQHRDSTALNIDVRITNGMGPSRNNLQRSIRSSLSLFHDSHGEDFVRDVEESLEDVTQAIDTQINQTNDFEFTIVELKGVKWSVQEPATFTVGASASHGRRDIQAVLDRIQTGIGDVLQGHNTAVRVNARKRGHLVFQEVIQTHEIPERLRETFQSSEEERSALTSRLKERIQRDIDMIFKDTCSIDDIALEEEERHPHPIEVPLSPGLSVEWPERQNGPSLEFPHLSAKTSTERINDNPLSFVKRTFSLKRRSTSSLRQSLRSIASSRSSLNSHDDTYSVDIPHYPEVPARPVSPTPATSTKSSKKRFSLSKKISNMFKSKDSKSDSKSEAKTETKSESSSKRRFFRSSSSKSANAAPAAPAEPKLMRAHSTMEGSGGRTLHRPTRSMTSNSLGRGSYDATHAARASVEHPRSFQAATPNLANRHGFASKTFETYPQPTEPRWSVDRLERPVMDTPQLYEDAKEFPDQLLTPGLTTRSTDTPHTFHWLASPGADAYSTAPSTPALSLGGESSPRHSLLISPIHVRHPELKDNTSSDFEPESEPEESEIGTGVTAAGTSVAAETELLEPPEDEVRSIVFAPQEYTTQPEELAGGSEGEEEEEEEAVKPESHDVSATIISVEDTTATPSDLHKTEPEPIGSGETLASENQQFGTESAPLSNETAPQESDFPNPDIRPQQANHETTVSVDARDANSETKPAPDNGTEVQNVPVVQNEERVAATETDYFNNFESLVESKPTADVIGPDTNATEANDASASLVDNAADDLAGLVAEPAITQSGPEEDKTEHQHDQQFDAQVSDVEDVPPSSTEEVAHDDQPAVNEFQSGLEEQTAELDTREADAVASETRDGPPSTDEVTQDLNDNVPEDEEVGAPSAEETSPEVDAPEAGEDNIKPPTEDLKQNGSVEFPSDVPEPSVADHTISEASGEPVEARENMVQTDTSSEESVSEHDKESSELADGDSISPAESETFVEDQEEEDMINTLASIHISNTDKATSPSAKGHHVFFPWTTSAVGPASELLESNSQHLDGSALVAHVEIPDLEIGKPSGLESKDVENILGPVSVPVESKDDVHFDNDASEIPDEIPNNLKQTDLEFGEKDRPHSPVDINLLQPSEALDSKPEGLDVSEGPEVAPESPSIQETDHVHIAPEAPLPFGEAVPLEEAPGARQAQKPEVALPEVDRADEPVALTTVEEAPDADEDYELSFGTVETAADIDAVEAVDDVQHVEHVEDVGPTSETTFEASDSQEDEKLEVSATELDVAAQNVGDLEEREQPFVSISDVVVHGHASDEVYDNWDVDVDEKPHLDERDTEYRDPTFPQFWPNSSLVFIPFAHHEALDNDTELSYPDSMSTKDVPALGVETVEHRDPTLPQFRLNDVLETAARSYAVSEAAEADLEACEPTEAVSDRVEENADYRDPTLPQFGLNDVLKTAPSFSAVSEAADEGSEAGEPTEAINSCVEERADHRDLTMPQFRPHVLLQPTPGNQRPSVSPVMAETDGYEEPPASVIDETPVEAFKPSEDDLDCRDPTMPQFRPNSFGSVRTPYISIVMAETNGHEEQPVSLLDETPIENVQPGECDLDYRDPTMPQFRPNPFRVVRRPSVSVLLAEANGYEEPPDSLIHDISAEALKPDEVDPDYRDLTMPHFRPNSTPGSVHIPSVSDQPVDGQGEQSHVPAEDDNKEISSQGDQSAEYRDPTMPQFKPNWDGPELPRLRKAGAEQPTQKNVDLTIIGPIETEKGEDATTEILAEDTESSEQLNESAQFEHVETEAPDAKQVREAKLVEVEASEHIQPDSAPATESMVDTHSVTENEDAEVEPSQPANVGSQPRLQSITEQSQETQEAELSRDQYGTLFEPVDPRSATEDGKIETGATKLSEIDSESASEPAFEPTSMDIPATQEEELYQDQYDALFEPREEHGLQVTAHEAALKFPEVPKIIQVDYRDPTMPQLWPNAVMTSSPISVPKRVQEPTEEINPDYTVERTMDVLDQPESEEKAGPNEEVVEQAIDLSEQVLEQFGLEAEQTEDLLEQLETEQPERAKEFLEHLVNEHALEEAETILEQVEAEAEQTEELLEQVNTEQAERVKELLEEIATEHALEGTDNVLEKIEAEAEQIEELLKKLDTEQTERTLEIAQNLEIQHSLEENEKALEQLDNEVERTEELLEQVDAEQMERVEELLDQLEAKKEIEQNEASLEDIDAEVERNDALLEELDVKQHERAEENLEQQESQPEGPQQEVIPTGTAESKEEPVNPSTEVPESFLDEFPEDKEQTAPSVILPTEAEVAEVAAEVPPASLELVSEPSTIEQAESGTTEMQDTRWPTVTLSDIQDVQLEHPGIELANLEDEGLEDADVESDVPAVEPTTGPVIVNSDAWIEHTDIGDAVLETPVPVVQRVVEETSTHEPMTQEVRLEFPNIEYANLEDEGLEDSELLADTTAAELAVEPVVINCDTWVEHADVEDAGVSAGGEATMGSIVIPVQSAHEEIPAKRSDANHDESTLMAECVAKPDLENLASNQFEQEISTNEPKFDNDIKEEELSASQVLLAQDVDRDEQVNLSEVVDRSLGDTLGAEDTDDSTGDVDTRDVEGVLRVESLDNLIRSAEAVERKLRELPGVEPATSDNEKTQGEEVTPVLEPVEEPLPPAPEAIAEETGDSEKAPLAIPTVKQEDVIADQEMLQDIPAVALPDLCLLEEVAPLEPVSAPAIGLVTKKPTEPAQQQFDIPNPRQAFGVSPRGSVDTIRDSDVDEEEAPELYAPPPTAGFFGFHHYHENKWAKVGLLDALINSASRRFSLPLQALLHRRHRSNAAQ
ncbi:hypothetical protein QBC45DRAFT_23008 [Copromyces sp. CBS 386.78]|nr:hypothetical protein QBC45DRAFT_23008 [Copromyces sp. CBS 386.78]